MPERKETGGKGRLPASFELVGLGDAPRPKLRVELVDALGARQPLEVSDKGEFTLDEESVGKGYMLEVGGPGGGETRRFGYDQFVETIRKDRVYRLPEISWKKFWIWNRCVTGRVTVCWPWPPFVYNVTDVAFQKVLFEDVSRILTTPDFASSHIHFRRCSPVCRGKVEVFVRTCCCPIIIDPPIIIKDLCEIIHCEEIEWPPKPWPDPGPLREIPMERVHPVTELAVATARSLKRATATDAAQSPMEIVRAARHMYALRQLPVAQQIDYIKAHPDLVYRHCTCSTKKVGEGYLQEDGRFDICFYEGSWLPLGCTRRVLYRVSQIQEGGWVVIYNGVATGESFPLDDEAVLYASGNADPCDGPHDWGPTPFVILERIGNTWADTLIHSTNQNGEVSALPTFTGPLDALDGLANAGPMASTAGPYNQPWGATLSLGYQFHPGLQALGAKYYRTRVVRVGSNGQPLGGPGAVNFTITGSLSWRKYYNPPGPDDVGVQWVPLHNPIINGIEGLYTIPYPDLVYPWLGGQWHADVATDELVAASPKMPNGRYLFVVDIFDATGKRMIPNGSLEPAGAGEVTAAFEYRRLDGPIDAPFSNTSVVPHRALASLFRVDNLSAYADIEAIRHGSTDSNANCQFLVGPGTDTVQLRYSAYQANGFQWYHHVWFKQGLTGPVTNLPNSTSNVFSGLTPALDFDDLLPGVDKKCAFAANLRVYVRHTNGIGRLSGYDREDQAAFAIEISP